MFMWSRISEIRRVLSVDLWGYSVQVTRMSEIMLFFFLSFSMLFSLRFLYIYPLIQFSFLFFCYSICCLFSSPFELIQCVSLHPGPPPANPLFCSFRLSTSLRLGVRNMSSFLLLLTCFALYRFLLVILLLTLSSTYSHSLLFNGVILFLFPQCLLSPSC